MDLDLAEHHSTKARTAEGCGYISLQDYGLIMSSAISGSPS